jgi:hypothetical protein
MNLLNKNFEADTLSEEDFLELLEEDDWFILFQTVRRNDLPLNYIEKLCFYKNNKVRQELVKYQTLSTNQIDKLCKDSCESVRLELVKKHANKLSEDNIINLSNDNNFLVLAEIALNTNTPLNIVNKLSEHKNSNIRKNIATRIDLSFDLIEKLAEDNDAEVIIEITKRKNLSFNLIEKLANHKKNYIKTEIMRREDLPIQLLKKLQKEEEIQKRSDFLWLKENNLLKDTYTTEEIIKMSFSFFDNIKKFALIKLS